jgi:hypothetical protein
MLFLKREEKYCYIWTCHVENCSRFILLNVAFRKFKHRHAKYVTHVSDSIFNVKPELFSTSQFHIYIYFSCIFKNSMTLFLSVRIWHSFQSVNYTVCFALQRLNLWNAIVINLKPEHYSTCSISFQFLLFIWLYSCEFECKNRIREV